MIITVFKRFTGDFDVSIQRKIYNVNITIYDPWANPDITKHEYGIEIVNQLPEEKFDTAIMAVAHNKFKEVNVISMLKDLHVIFDVKGVVDSNFIDGRL